MGQRPAAFATENNRRSAANGHERCCAHCREWMHVSLFKISHGYVGYSCKPCERELQRRREMKLPTRIRRKRPMTERVRTPQFDESRVDVAGLLRFTTMPTPAQLLEKAA